MRPIAIAVLVMLGALSGAAGDGRQSVARTDGIAAKYPGDVGIEKDPAVVLYEGFEQDLKLVPWMQPGGWFDIDIGPGKGAEYSTQSPAAGKRCLQYNLKTGKQGSGGMFHLIPPSDTIYFRYYRRFADNWQWPDGYGPHDAMIFGGAWTAPTDTDLSIYADFWMTGDTVVRIATAKQKLGYDGWHQYLKQRYPRTPAQDPPGGNAFPWNRSRPDKIVPGKWHCVEVMVKLATPGKDDGEVRLWVNGKLVSEYTDVPLRDEKHPDLKLNMVFLAPYFHPGSPRDQVHWADGLVVATRYIGPIAP
jgi:hypothetical protein